MAEAENQITTPITPFTFEIVDLSTHPDGELLRWISEASHIRAAPAAPRVQTPQEYRRVYGDDAFYLVQLDECIRRRKTVVTRDICVRAARPMDHAARRPLGKATCPPPRRQQL